METATVKDYVETLKPYRKMGWDNLSTQDREYFKLICNSMISAYPEYEPEKGQFRYEKVNNLIDSELIVLGRPPEGVSKR